MDSVLTHQFCVAKHLYNHAFIVHTRKTSFSWHPSVLHLDCYINIHGWMPYCTKKDIEKLETPTKENNSADYRTEMP